MGRLLKILYFVCVLGYNILNVYFAKIIMNITDALSANIEDLFFFYLKIGAAAVAALLFMNYISVILQNYIIRDDVQRAQCRSFGSILSEEKRELEEDEYNKDFSFLTKEMDLYENKYIQRKLSMISNLILFIASSCMVFSINHKLLIVIMGLVLLMAAVPFFMNGRLQTANEMYLKSNEKLYAKTGEYLHGFETIKNFFAEREILRKYEEYAADNNEKKRHLSDKLGFTNAITAFLGILIIFTTFIVGGLLIFSGELTIGAIFATVQLVTNMVNPLTELLYGINEINAVKAITAKIRNNLNTIPEYKEYEQTQDRTDTIKIKNVSFLYEKQTTKVLNDVSVNFERGKMYALVGENGSGKSTIGKLIAGYYLDYSGEIMIDDRELKTIDYTDLRRHIAYINQEPFVFDAAASDNCTVFGKYNIKNEYIKEFECEQLLSNQEKSAINLSGGEKQKLVFLRSLNLDFDIIIYDEAEASMDIIARKKLLEFLGKQKDKIIICISHSVDNSLEVYDEIMYMKKGVITEQGSFRQLYDDHGGFYDFYNKKTS